MRAAFVIALGVFAAACGGGKSTCAAGDSTCACLPGDACHAGLTCQAGTCVTSTQCPTGDTQCQCSSGNCLSVTVDDASVRGCDVLVTSGTRSTTYVAFGSGARGSFLGKDGKTAVSVIAETDAALSGDVATLVFSGGSIAAGSVTADAKCVDKDGKPIAAPGVSIR